jgi:hypothetical protein
LVDASSRSRASSTGCGRDGGAAGVLLAAIGASGTPSSRTVRRLRSSGGDGGATSSGPDRSSSARIGMRPAGTSSSTPAITPRNGGGMVEPGGPQSSSISFIDFDARRVRVLSTRLVLLCSSSWMTRGTPSTSGSDVGEPAAGSATRPLRPLGASGWRGPPAVLMVGVSSTGCGRAGGESPAVHGGRRTRSGTDGAAWSGAKSTGTRTVVSTSTGISGGAVSSTSIIGRVMP